MLSPICVGMSTDTIFVDVLLGIVDISLGIVSWSFLECNLTADFLFPGILQYLYSLRMSYNNCVLDVSILIGLSFHSQKKISKWVFFKNSNLIFMF